MVTAYDFPQGRAADAGGSRHRSGRRLAGHGGPRPSRHPVGDHGRDDPPHQGGAAGGQARPAGGRHALRLVPPRPEQAVANADPLRQGGRRAGGEDRRRRRRRDRGARSSPPRCRSWPTSASRRSRSTAWAASRSRAGTTGRAPHPGRRAGAGGGRRLLARPRMRADRSGRRDHGAAGDPDHRHRRRRRTATARCWSTTTSSGWRSGSRRASSGVTRSWARPRARPSPATPTTSARAASRLPMRATVPPVRSKSRWARSYG